MPFWEAVKHSGGIPKVIHTDHATIVRQVDLPLGRIGPMDYRWMTELKRGGGVSAPAPSQDVPVPRSEQEPAGCAVGDSREEAGVNYVPSGH